MYIFDEDYQYKIKIVGYRTKQTKTKDKNFNLFSVFLRSHNILYEVQYKIDYKTKKEELQLIASPDISKIKADNCGVADNEEIMIKKVKTEELSNYDIQKVVIALILPQITSEKVIITDFFLLDIEGSFLLPFVDKFKECKIKELKEKLSI